MKVEEVRVSKWIQIPRKWDNRGPIVILIK